MISGQSQVNYNLLRELHRLRWGVRLAIPSLILLYIPINRYLFAMSWQDIWILDLNVFFMGQAIFHVASARFIRLQKQSRYPNALAVELGGIQDLWRASDFAVRWCCRFLGAEAALLALLDQKNRLIPAAMAGIPPEAMGRLRPLSIDYEPIRAALQSEKAILGPPSQCPCWSGFFDDRYRAAYIPLISLNRVIGILLLVAATKADDVKDGRLLESLGVVIGLSLDNMRLSQRESESIMQVLSTALDMRDHVTEGHCQRVAQLASLVAQQMGLPQTEVKRIEQAAALHDIGKIGVADAVLSKPGPLTEEEWQEMRRHPQLGYRILKDIDFLKEPAEIVYAHHERYDGSGYPRGVRGEKIPLSARIFAVVDAYDAITSYRPYRQARSHTDALAEIQRNSGSQFDPNVVQAFLELERLGLVHHHQQREEGDPSSAV